MISKWILVFTLLSSSLVYGQEISDDLVSGLRCDGLSTDSIYKSIKPEAFSSERQISLANWGFRWGFYNLANCWSLSHSQRLFFYLSRFNQGQQLELLKFFDQVRGFQVYQDHEGEIRQYRFKANQIFEVAETDWKSGQYLDQIKKGLKQQLEQGALVQRNYIKDTEAYQVWRFHQVKNTPMIIQKAPRSVKHNLRVFDSVIDALNKKQLPLLVLKAKLTTQHVVIVKRIDFQNDELVRFLVYDSNYPNLEMPLYYYPNEGHFRAPEIMRGFKLKDSNMRLGVYIVDQKDHDQIGTALLSYYKKICD